MIVRYLLLIVLLACNELCCVSNSYDTSITLFSNSGELLQVVYARLAGLKGESAICGIDEEKREILLCYKVAAQSQKLLDRSHIEKLSRIDDHLYMTFAGLAGDGRAIVKRAREFCIEMYCKLGMRPSVACVAAEVAKWQHEATLYGGRRPYGIQVLIFGKDPKTGELQLFKTEPSGSFGQFEAAAIGRDSDILMSKLEQRWTSGSAIKRNDKWLSSTFRQLLGDSTTDDTTSTQVEREKDVLELISIRSITDSLRVYHKYQSYVEQ